MRRTSRLLAAALVTLGCSSGDAPGFAPATDAALVDRSTGSDAPVSPPADVAPSAGVCPVGGSAQLTGRTFAPNGRDPIPGVRVYVVPAGQAFAPPATGVVCQHCAAPPAALASTLSNPDGTFTLYGAALDPGGTFAVAFESGGFRHVEHAVALGRCGRLALPAARTRLPGVSAGDDAAPRIAVAGYRTAPSGPRTVDVNDRFTHVLDAIGLTAYDTFDPDRAGTNGGRGPDLLGLLADATTLARYQILITPCGVLGVFDPSTHLTAPMIANLQGWLARGGRLYASDLAYPIVAHAYPGGIVFASGHPARGEPADIGVGLAGTAALQATVDEPGLRAWLQQVGAVAPGASTLPVLDLRDPWAAMDTLPSAELMPGPNGSRSGTVWVSGDVSWHEGPPGPHHHPLTVQVDYPGAGGDYCGRIVFTSYHVQTGTGATLSPQERVLEYLFFQLSSCIQVPG
ncbi:MAG: hypothetical protein EPO40_02615 [Myxococcaceae bacterium]|nr:MAG: hypothetical protein EPO40_02615 [Myxococcaceae bacterium]